MTRVVIGLGNPYRRDDAAGLEVARRMRVGATGAATIFEHDGEPTGLLDFWEGAGTAYVVDAVRGDSPGRVHRLEVTIDGALGLPRPHPRESSHDLGLRDVIELGRVLGRLPPRLVLLGIEAAEFGMGVGLSAEVDRAVSRMAAELVDELIHH